MYFRLHSERAEQYRYCPRLPDGFHERVAAVGMIAVYEHYFGLFPADRVLYKLCPSEKSRLQTPELHHQTQQRRDDFFARENQHLTQRNQPRRERN